MEHRKILDGPSQWDTILSLFDGQRVAFVCDKGDDLSGNYSVSLSVWITSIERKGARGLEESWKFKGADNAGRSVKGYFSTKTRKGEMDIGTADELYHKHKLGVVTKPMTEENWAHVEISLDGKLNAVIAVKAVIDENGKSASVQFHNVPLL